MGPSLASGNAPLQELTEEVLSAGTVKVTDPVAFAGLVAEVLEAGAETVLEETFDSAIHAALASGEVDMAVLIDVKAARDLALTNPHLRFEYKQGGLRVIKFNLTRPYLQDVRVRQALNYAIDKQAIVDEIFLGVWNFSS